MLGDELDREAVMAGDLTPMFFGSAMTNFGVETFLQTFISEAAQPGEQQLKSGKALQPTDEHFSGLVFKLQVGTRDEVVGSEHALRWIMLGWRETVSCLGWQSCSCLVLVSFISAALMLSGIKSLKLWGGNCISRLRRNLHLKGA